MEIQKRISLRPYNTFGIDVFSEYFVEVSSLEELKEAIQYGKEQNLSILFLNGGSNILFTKDWNGLVVKINLKGIEIVRETEDFVWVKVQAGENWHEFVQFTLAKNYGGLQNLSLIPGNAGTAPMQNIGAYGVEIKDLMTELTAMEISTGNLRVFSNADCQFGYRESVFKNELKNQFVLLDVTFQLSKRNHVLHTEYGAIQSELANMGCEKPTIQDVSRAVIQIRQSKLPDPNEIGNSGSFFKNPVISAQKFEEIKKNYPNISGYSSGDSVKVAAGWLIENAGWKGKQFGDAGVHEKQALVLVNYGNATGKEIYDLSQSIIDSIQFQYGITLEREVNII
ncbi:UDP-N-acetylmuramate dehydrogenase [Moheibacter stercoris]|uniref:UDP-N-acetylenolpyruvoylglucosamine reductase n=1 Tax=Moheibacter stercoris TaxID=1628251 RepID=A0ABV2LT39_9FLAO